MVSCTVWRPAHWLAEYLLCLLLIIKSCGIINSKWLSAKSFVLWLSNWTMGACCALSKLCRTSTAILFMHFTLQIRLLQASHFRYFPSPTCFLWWRDETAAHRVYFYGIWNIHDFLWYSLLALITSTYSLHLIFQELLILLSYRLRYLTWSLYDVDFPDDGDFVWLLCATIQ